MKKWNLASRAATGAVAVAGLLATAVLVAPGAQAATQFRQANGSASQTFAFAPGYASPFAETYSFSASTPVVLGADKSNTLSVTALQCPATATQSKGFISPEQLTATIDTTKFSYGTAVPLTATKTINASSASSNLVVSTLLATAPAATSRYWMGYECQDAVGAVVSNAGVPQRFYRTISVDAQRNWTLIPDSAVQGAVTVTTPVIATAGQLGVTLSSGSVTLGTPTLVAGRSTSTGTLPTISVSDTRSGSRPGWNLNVLVSDFVNTTNAAQTIAASNLTVTPTLVSTTQAATAGTEFTGSPTTAAVLGTAPATNAGTTSSIAAALTFRAPMGSAAGTYQSVISVTLVSK